MESASESRGARSPEVSEHGLKENAIGFRDALIIGIASTAPLWSGPFKNAILVSTLHKLLRISEALVL